ncbi:MULTISPECIES: flagellar basal body rod protein FlgB [unclassified Paludibacterium]|uniref:flagellar basal body rod protein FlgB n=1 Tax=unclassified Paludibacterium TaxID=2618429 RepID=UPI001C05D43F|nr:flagellar basal body rod protein FlgB [Paludibacterium sp. B53371]BEV71515.1 flagellar basal body rod protein FlgB [Paludibacterium sp. THUN1379]
MFDKIANDFKFDQRALNLRAYRTEVLAGNMANAETPYYKAVDFDFAATMKAQMDGHGSGKDLALMATDPRHFSTNPGDGGASVPLQYRNAVQPSVDGNTVDMDVERGAFMDNALQYQSTLTFLNHRISQLNLVLKG